MYIFQPDRYLLDKQIKKFAHYISGRVLDVGAGTINRYQKYFKADEYITTDYLPGPNISIVASADNLPFADGEFDAVVSTQVFEHLEFPEKAAAEISRVLKIGGHLLVTIPQTNELHEEPHDYFRYTRYGLEALFCHHGFKLIEIDQRGGYYVMMCQMKTRFLMQRYNLYERPWLGHLMSKMFKIMYLWSDWRDRRDSRFDNRRHAIGWVAIFEKQDSNSFYD